MFGSAKLLAHPFGEWAQARTTALQAKAFGFKRLNGPCHALILQEKREKLRTIACLQNSKKKIQALSPFAGQETVRNMLSGVRGSSQSPEQGYGNLPALLTGTHSRAKSVQVVFKIS